MSYQLYQKFCVVWRQQILLKVLLSVMGLTLVTTSAVAQGFGSPGGSFYEGQSRPNVPSQRNAEELDKVGWTQNLNNQVPLDLPFQDDEGNAVTLQQYFDSKPVLIVPVYYYCPMLCGEVLRGTFRTLEELKFRPGRDYEVVVVSINPKEGPDIAKIKKEEYVRKFGMEKEAGGIHFLTGEETSIKPLANAMGFDYSYDAQSGQYAHAAGFVLATPQGNIARYMTGVIFEPKDLRLGFLEAGEGKIGSPLDLIVLKCYQFDGHSGTYTFAIMDVLRIAGIVTVVLIGLLMVVLVRRDSSQSNSNEEEL